MQRGDTIVEVLIAIAVVSMVLGSAYAITNRTVKSQQLTIEHTEALKLVESQLEAVRADVQANGASSAVFAVDDKFCFQGTTFKSDEASCTSGPNLRYTVYVTRDTSDSNKFSSRATWKGVNGGDDTVSLTYKVYP